MTKNENKPKQKAKIDKKDKEIEIEDAVKEKNKVKKENEFINIAKQLQADFDNYRKRSIKEIFESKEKGIIEAINKFLPAIDGLEKAHSLIKDKNTLSGIEMITKQFTQSLKDLNVEKIKTKGKQFDPNIANVVATSCDNSLEDDIVIEELQAGYKINKKIIRYAQVVVNKK